MFESTAGKTEQVRELCRRLRPILGAKIEQIYSAYLAEDAEGRIQIQNYLEPLAARHLPQKLGDEDVVLIPPSPEQARGEYPFGQVYYMGKHLYPFGLRENEWIQHMAILGRSGGGKTNLGFQILAELKKRGKPFLIFDWKRNYRDLLILPEFRDVEVYTIGRDIAPLTFNPLIPPAGTDPKTWLKKLNEVIAHSYCLGNGVLFLLQQAVDAVYEEAGVYDNLVKKWPTFKDDLLNTCGNRSIDHILDSNVILELDGLSQADKTFFVQACLLYLHHKKMAENVREHFDRCVVIEEAHHILSGQRTPLTGGESVMDTIYREIREFGVSLILLDQMPSKLSSFAMANSYTVICMSMSNKADISAVAQNLLLDTSKDILGTLEVGQAVVKLQGRIPRPFQISIPEFKIRKGRMADADIRTHMEHLVPSIADEATASDGSQGETVPPEPTAGPMPSSNNAANTFLDDIKHYPDSGVAARYKRLGLSVRQGQNLKSQLADQGLIEEHLEITDTGRRMTVRLTAKGGRLLSETKKAA